MALESGGHMNRRNLLKSALAAALAVPLNAVQSSAEAALPPDNARQSFSRLRNEWKISPEFKAELEVFEAWFNTQPEGEDFYTNIQKLPPGISRYFQSIIKDYVELNARQLSSPVRAFADNQNFREFALKHIPHLIESEKNEVLLIFDLLSIAATRWLAQPKESAPRP